MNENYKLKNNEKICPDCGKIAELVNLGGEEGELWTCPCGYEENNEVYLDE